MANFEDLLYLIENTDNYVLEMKTKSEYARRKFKKKYKFTPSKDNPNIGTIVVDGDTYTVDIGKNSALTLSINGDEIKIPRNIFTKMGEDYIVLDEVFFKLKNQKRRDGILQHEIAHTKLHPYDNIDKKTFRKDIMTKSTIRDVLKSLIRDQLLVMGYNVTNSELNSILSETLENDKNLKKLYDRYLNVAKNTDENKRKMRDEAQSILRKHTSASIIHNHVMELEADRYAANRTSSSDFKKGLRECVKKTIKASKPKIKEDDNIDDDNDKKEKYKKMYNRFDKEDKEGLNEDLRRRSKALSDKNINRNPIFKKLY